jgi:hypothetical protein
VLQLHSKDSDQSLNAVGWSEKVVYEKKRRALANKERNRERYIHLERTLVDDVERKKFR